MKMTNGEEDFYTIADDNNYYQAKAIELIDSVGIQKFVESGQYLRLKGVRQTWDLNVRKKNLPSWNIIFFKTNKKPEIISAVDLTADEIKVFFGVK